MRPLFRALTVAGVALLAGCGAGGSRTALPETATSATRTVETSHNVLAGTSYNVLAGTSPNVLAGSMCTAPGSGYTGCQVVHNTQVPALPNPNLPAAQVPGYHPEDLQAAYGFTGVTGGADRTVAIVDAYDDPNVEADLAVYRRTFGLPPCTTANGCFQKLSLQNTPKSDAGWSLEIALDTQMVSAACPRCKIILIEAPDTRLSTMLSGISYAVMFGATDISSSFYGPEPSKIKSYESILAALNVPITVSAGDTGYGATYPASSAYVTAVGGTTLTRSGSARGWNEVAWQWTSSGCSAVVSKPAWQHDSLCTKRTVADIAVVADPNTGVAVYNSYTDSKAPGGWVVLGGTSAGAPLVAGLRAAAEAPVSNMSAAKGYLHSDSFNHVTAGTTVNCAPVTYLCSATSGYSGPAGVGTPYGPASFQ